MSWNPPATLNPPQTSFSSSSSSNQNPFNSFNSVGSSLNNNLNNEFVPSSPPKVHEANDYTSHDIHVNSRPHSIPPVEPSSRDLSRDASISSSAPLQNSRQFESNIQPVGSPNEKAIDSSTQPAKPKPAHTIVKNGDGKKDDVVIYYYYYYDDDKNKTTSGSSTVSPSLDIIPSLDQYDNVPAKKPVSNVVESTQPPKPNSQPIVPVQPVSNVNKPTEFKIDGNTFKFDTTGFTPITTTPSSSNNAYNNNLFRSQDRGVHVHNNPLYGSGKFILLFVV